MDDENEVVEQEEFHIDTEEKANWLLRKIATIDAEKARVKAQADTIVKQLEGDRERLMGRFGAELEEWTRGELERRGGKRKSIVLLQGTCAFRAVPPRLVVSSEEEALAFAKAEPGLAQFVVQKDVWAPSVSALFGDPTDNGKTVYLNTAHVHLERTGELLPGIERTEARESFSIKFPGGKE